MSNTIQLYNERSQCCGCGACMQACENNAIAMKEDEEGFLYPVINEELCVHCGMCLQKCQIHKRREPEPVNIEEKTVLAVKNRNEMIRKKSSSGGVFYSLAAYIVSLGGVVFGAAFNNEFEVEHIGVCEEQNIEKLMGSKYVQSNVKTTYRDVKNCLREGKWVLYVGTPCQVTGLCSFLGSYNKDKLICVSIICHGVCSPMVWRRYLKLKKGQYAEDEITQISFRGKKNGWRNYEMEISFGDMDYSQSHTEDLYMKGFLQNLYSRPACYECVAKDNQEVADLIIGDFWGIENSCPEIDDDRGVSCILLNSPKGENLWEQVQEEFCFEQVNYVQMAKGNSSIKNSVSMNQNRGEFFKELKITGLIEESIENNLKARLISKENRQITQYPIVYRYLSNMTKGISIGDFIERIGWKKIALYAVTDLMEITYQDILHSEKDISIICVCDKGYKKYLNPYRGVPVVGLERLKECFDHEEIDGVIVCNPLRENAIFEDLREKHIPLENILSVTSAIFD